MIPLYRVHLPPREKLLPALAEVLYSGQISEGEPVYDFERAFAARFQLPPALAFYAGTAALHTALLLAGVAPGDEVISTPVTTEPTNMAILHAGARIAWADVDPRNGNLLPESVDALVTPRTRAIMAVDYAGVPVAHERLAAVAARQRLPVIEDAAHALGARYAGRWIGDHSPFVVFSFQAIKHLTTVDGGMLVCRDAAARERGRLVRWFGIDRTRPRDGQDVREIGYKYHMNNVNAVIGSAQLGEIDAVIARHKANGRFLDERLRGIAGLETCRWDAAAEPAYWIYTVLAERRDDLARKLDEQGIMASTASPRNDAHAIFREHSTPRELPGVERFMRRLLHIPCGWWVTDEDRERIVDVIRGGW